MSKSVLLAVEWLEEFDWHGEDDGRVLFGGDLSEGLKVSQLKRRMRLIDDVGRILQSLGRLLLPLRRYHLE